MKKKKQVVFIEGFSMPMTYKIAGLFRKKGYETVLIRLLDQVNSDKFFYNPAYNKVIDFRLTYHKITNKNILKALFSNLKKIDSFFISFLKILNLKPYVIFGRAPLSAPIAFFRKIFRKTPFVYFPYDIRSQALPTLEAARKKMPLFEIKADKFCFENCDGIMHKGSPEELNYLNGRMLGNVKLPPFQIAFHPYCSEEFCVPINKNKLSKKDGELHFVNIGGAGKKSKEFYFDQLKCFEGIIKQKIHIHFYYCPEISEEDSENDDLIIKEFNEAYKNYPNIKYFHLEKSLNPKEIVKEISKYDFGISMPPGVPKENGIEPIFCIGTKTSAYLEAGIPLFYESSYEFIGRLMKQYKINLPYPKNLSDLKDIIDKINYKQFEKNVLKARQDFDMDKNFPRLEQFVKKVVDSKKQMNQAS